MQVGALVHSTSIMQAGRGELTVEDLDVDAEARTDGRQDEVRQATLPREVQAGAAEDAGPPPLPGSPTRAEAPMDLQAAREALRELEAVGSDPAAGDGPGTSTGHAQMMDLQGAREVRTRSIN